MKHTFAAVLALLLALLLTCASADSRALNSLDELPETTDDGFLPEGAEAVYFTDFEAGNWLWLDASARIEITRTRTPNLVYYIADLRFAPGSSMYTVTYNTKKPGRTSALPQDMARTARAVYAQSGDFYSYRVKQDRYPGIVIRNGKVLYKKTYSKYVHAVPNLANLAFYNNGDARVYEAWEKKAQAYIKEGAQDVLAFGPLLLRSGEIPDLNDKAYTHLEPRSCFGIIGRGHFVGLVVEGRKDHSEGATLKTCAQILQDYGCEEAINLDGGNTAAMLFMGESVQLNNAGGPDAPDRAIPDILAAGTY